MDQHLLVTAMLYLSAAVSVAAAGYALVLVPLSGTRTWWLVLCVALGLQAVRRVVAVTGQSTIWESVTGLMVSTLFLVGLVGIRHMFVMLRKTRRLLDAELGGHGGVENRAGASIVVLDRDGRVLETNDSARLLMRGSASELLGADWFGAFVPEKSRSDARAAFARLVGSSRRNDEYVEHVVVDLGGDEHSVVWHRRVLRDDEGAPLSVRCAGVDLTHSTFLERELAFRSLLLDHTNDSVLVYRSDGTVVYANDTACAYRGVRREDLVGADIHQLIPPADRGAFAVHMETVEHGGYVTFETEIVDREGIVRPVEVRARSVDLRGDHLIIHVGRDITERREAEAAMRRMAYTDHLTGLPNRVLLADRATQAIARASRGGLVLALLYMDLDRIKAVNDGLGHTAGDELLRQVGVRLADAFRDEDTVARVGGDEFVLLVRVADVAEAGRVAQRLVDLIAAPYVIGGETASTSASVGVALFPGDGVTLEELTACADAAMYVAKEQGRNRFHIPDDRPRVSTGP
jgi:diguanylate cyclase (GGDEF)-like protein/PAS domain S-box-containing protein